jgi:hypothetical protein
MALDATIRGSVTGLGAEVNASNQLKVITETDASTNPDNVGTIRIFSENDPGSITGTPLLRSPEVSQDYRMRVGVDTLIFADTFNSATQNTSLWKHAFSTMTMTQSAGFLNVNAAGTSTVATNFAYLQSWRHFTFFGTAPVSVETTLQFDKYPIANEVLQWGLGVPTGAVDVVDGAWFQLTSAGLIGVIRYNSGTVVTTSLVSSVNTLPLNSVSKYAMVCGEDAIEFWIDDVLYGEIEIPNAQGQPFLSTSLPYFIQKYNNGVVGTSPNLIAKVGDVTITLMDLASNQTWANQMASIGLGMQMLNGDAAAIQTPQVQWGLSALPTAAAATNSSAALGAFLAGIFLQTTVATGAGDLIISSYQNPIGGVNRTPRTIKLRGIKIDCVLTGTAIATTPSTFALAVVWGSTQVSLATVTADTASFANNTAKAARRQPIGVITFPTGAAVGTAAAALQFDFEAPLVINPGEFIQVIQKPLVATSTAGNIYNWIISPNLYHE